MKIQTSTALAAALLLARVSVASAAGVPPLRVQTSTGSTATPNRNGGETVTYYNQQGKAQTAPTHFAEIWGDAGLGV
jgi:hypothetical protein